MKTKGKLIPVWLSRYVDRVENALFLGRLDEFWNRLAHAAAIQPSEQVLDVGCGSGQLTAMLGRALEPGGSITGLDAAPAMIRECRKQMESQRIHFVCGLMERLPFHDGHFNVVVSSLALHHVPKTAKQQALAEMHRVLAPGGRLLILDHGRPYRWFLRLLLYPLRWNIGEYQAENFKGQIPQVIAEAFQNVEEVDRFFGWIRIWKAVKP